VLLVIALLGGRLAPHEPIYFVVEHGTDPRPYDPGLVFPFGSDVLGRDGAAVAAVGSMWRPARPTLALEAVGVHDAARFIFSALVLAALSVTLSAIADLSRPRAIYQVA
jgi:hypothetical protein